MVIAAPEFVEGREDLRGRQALLAERQNPVVGAPAEHRSQLVTTISAQSGTAGQVEWHIGPQPGTEIAHFLRRDVQIPQHGTGQQRGGGVRGATGHASGDRNGFADHQVHAHRLGGHQIAQEPGRANRQVRVIGGHLIGLIPEHGDSESVGLSQPCLDLVIQRDGLEDGGQRMVAIWPARPTAQGQVDLGRHPYPDDFSLCEGGCHVARLSHQRAAAVTIR